ncbi:hypothetical protein KDL01_37090 [Actinospica durhamensis]|uniref:Uncharacterized protein n=1 Tax=Actinospica durhamensis TaxID=1508375 RepID=A0A941EX56_9ACTN|nr:DUF5947 family protein [Actinospica durhamensis]MBR7838943.1 hypothetical protein [Actinospica durhamensis]
MTAVTAAQTVAPQAPAPAESALARAIRRPAPAAADDHDAERCDVCAADVPPAHRHLLDAHSGEIQCACRACAVLFERDAAGAAQAHFHLVPTRRRRLPGGSAEELAQLGLPVGLAFIVIQPDGAPLAHYPSPAGATRWELDPEVWQRVARQYPDLAELEPQVQALLLHTARGNDEHWIVPIDDCYRLVAVIRREWRGLSGGSTVWPAIADFFTRLDERSDHG